MNGNQQMFQSNFHEVHSPDHTLINHDTSILHVSAIYQYFNRSKKPRAQAAIATLKQMVSLNLQVSKLPEVERIPSQRK